MPKKISTSQKKKWIFGHFCDFGKITKMAKNPFFFLKGGNFFRHTLIIWGDNFLYFLYFLIRSKKMGILLRRVQYPEFQPEGLVPYPSQQNGSSGFKYRCLSEV